MSKLAAPRPEESLTIGDASGAESEIFRHPPHQLHHWQERTIHALLIGTTILGIGALTTKWPLAARQGRWDVLALIGGTYFVILVLALLRRIPFSIRSGIFIVAFYLVGLFDLVTSGLSGDGRAFLLAFPLLVAVLLGPQTGIGALILSMITLTFTGWAMVTGHLVPIFEPRTIEPLPWITSIIIYLLLAMVVLVPTSYVINNLIATLDHALEEGRRRWREVRQLSRDQERQVEERTAALSRRSIQLEAAAQVAREAATIRDIGRLMNTTVHLISDRFGFYHAGIFLLDEAREYAVLRAASSDGGQRMLARGHKLKVEKAEIVGYAAETGKPRIALDVGADAVHFAHPDLPDTRSEMGLPLKVQERVIGVLDVQSKEAAAFSDEDVAILQTMADQVALAIENARLLKESQQALRELEILYGQQVREVWQERTARQPAAYRYTGTGVEPVRSPSALKTDAPLHYRWPAVVQEPIVVQENDGRRLIAPIRLRGQALGFISLRQDREEEPWSNEEIALVEEVSTQIGLALENANLLEETQQRAERERLIADITTRVRDSMDPETILQTAVRELGAALGTDRAFVQLGVGAQDNEQ